MHSSLMQRIKLSSSMTIARLPHFIQKLGGSFFSPDAALITDNSLTICETTPFIIVFSQFLTRLID